MSIDHSPTAATGQRCQCGHVVSQQFVRVFGRDGELYACLECSTRDALAKGAGADPDFERRVEAPLPEARKQRGDTDRAVGGVHR
jgi:hypothetical protein